MPKTIISEEIIFKAKQELKKSDKDRVHLKLLAIVSAGEHSIIETAAFFKIRRKTVYNWIRRFRDEGVSGLFDKPKGHYPSKLNEKHKSQLDSWLECGCNADGKPVHWTIDLLRHEIKRVFGIEITNTPLWKLLKKMGFRQKVPRPVHIKSSKEEQATFKKNS